MILGRIVDPTFHADETVAHRRFAGELSVYPILRIDEELPGKIELAGVFVRLHIAVVVEFD